ncbi:MAG: hypothetical protein N2C12_10835, partial [Planctomycetales bacterium]
RIERSQGIRPSSITLLASLRISLAVLLTLPIYALAVFSANHARSVSWRGITYRVDPVQGIRMVSYRPFLQNTRISDSPYSI